MPPTPCGRWKAPHSPVSGDDRWVCTRPWAVPTSGCAGLASTSKRSTSGRLCVAPASVPASAAAAGREWLEKYSAGVHYDGDRLTPDILERQVRSYYALKEIIAEGKIDFCGIKGQPELTNNFATADIAEAFLNDPYDWDGPKAPVICATEDDMDGALTMQLMHKVTGTPVLFADVRHYFPDRGIWDLENSGQHATWFAARSDDPAENLSKVHLYPEEFYFPAGGAAVHHLAAAGDITLARLSRRRQLPHAGHPGSLRDLRRRDQRGPDAPEHVRLAARLYPYGRPCGSVPVPFWGEPHPRRTGRRDRGAELAAICGFLDVDLERLDKQTSP